MKKNIKNYLALVTLLFLSFGLFAQQGNIIIPKDMNTALPVDPKITTGKLDNGIKYYIRKNEKPKNRAELRLVVNVGSILEDEDQRGLAHFCEHMAFNGTKNFEENHIVSFLESIGMKFGAEVNAYTGFDETVYMLTIPMENKSFLDTGFMILSDWAHNVAYTAEEIDKERGVIHEEWRLGRGANDRMMREYFPVMFHNSHYAERLPIGKMDIVDNCPHDALRRFYKDWYRPDLQAVVAVGDFDVKEVENYIKRYFSPIKLKELPRERKLYDVPDHKKPLVSIVSDKENPYTMLQMYIKHDKAEEGTYQAYRNNIVRSLFSSMLSNRLSEKLNEKDPPFMFAYGGYSNLIRTKDAFMLMAMAKNNKVEESLKILVEETERIKRHGFTITELERQKIEMLSGIEKMYNERDKQKSSAYVGEYQRNYLHNESIPGIEYEFELYKKFLPTIKVEELNMLVEKYVTDKNTVIVVTLPEKKSIVKPEKKELLKIIKDVRSQKDIEAYVDKVSNEPLINTDPKPGKVVSTKDIKEFEAKEITLSNGVKVVLKKTDFKNDEILMQAYSLGGNSLYGIEDDFSASYADNVINNSGLANFDNIELKKMLAGKIVSVSPWISEMQEGLRGRSTPKDFETMLQLVHLYFTSPRKDSKAYDNFISEQENMLKNREASPRTAFGDTITVTMAQHHPRRMPTTIEDLKDADHKQMLKIYKERFENAGDFTFFFVGNFDMEIMTSLLEVYLGSLPSSNKNETWKDLGIRDAKGVIEKTVHKGVEPKATVFMSFQGESKYDFDTRLKMKVLTSILTIRLRENIREKQGGVYSISCWARNSHYPVEKYNIGIYFGCAPSNVDNLVNSVFDEIKMIKKDGGTQANLDKVTKNMLRTRETKVRENNFWLGTLKHYYYHNEDFSEFAKYEEAVRNIKVEDIIEVANKYINKENYIKVVLLPEKGTKEKDE